jgi:hypothetical protein
MAIRTLRPFFHSSPAIAATDAAFKRIQAILAQHPIVQS